MRFEFWIAWRFLFNPGRFQTAHFIALASALAFMAVAAAMVISLSGFNGLRELVLTGYRWSDPDLKVQKTKENSFKITELPLENLRSSKMIKGVFAAVESDALAVKGGEFAVVRLRGVESVFFNLQSDMPLAYGAIPAFPEEVLTGVSLSEKLGLSSSEPERITLYYPGRLGRTLFTADAFTSRSVVVAGSLILDQESNARLVLGRLETMQELMGRDSLQISWLGLLAKEDVPENALKNEIKASLPAGFEVLNRLEQQKDVYKVLRVEKLAVFIVLGFIATIASFILFGAASLIMLEKQRSAAVLSSLGCSANRLRRIFAIWILLVAGTGILTGLAAGSAIIFWQKTKPFVTLGSDNERSFPVALQSADIVAVSVFLLMLTFLTAVLRLTRFKPELQYFQTFKA